MKIGGILTLWLVSQVSARRKLSTSEFDDVTVSTELPSASTTTPIPSQRTRRRRMEKDEPFLTGSWSSWSLVPSAWFDPPSPGVRRRTSPKAILVFPCFEEAAMRCEFTYIYLTENHISASSAFITNSMNSNENLCSTENDKN